MLIARPAQTTINERRRPVVDTWGRVLPSCALYGLAAVALAFAARWIYGPGLVGYDPAWTLVWGRETLAGGLPQVNSVPTSPTPHPLMMGIGTLAAVTGGRADDVLAAVSFLSLGVVAVATFAAGRTLTTAAGGVVAAMIVTTRPQLVIATLEGLVEVPFLAVLMAALALEVRRPRCGLSVAALLAAAGLLRPEAWTLALAYLGWTWRTIPANRRPVAVLAAIFGPTVWAGMDTLLTGDPLYSLHATQGLAAMLDRPRGLAAATQATPVYLLGVLPPVVIFLGLAGAFLLVVTRNELTNVLLVLLIAGVGSFLVLGVAQLPLLDRYALIPAATLALLAGAALTGWLHVRRGVLRWVWCGAAVIVAATIVVSALPSERASLRATIDWAEAKGAEQEAARDVLTSPRARRQLEQCQPLWATSFLERPLLAYRLERSPRTILTGTRAFADSQLILVPVATRRPVGFRRVAGNVLWALDAKC